MDKIPRMDEETIIRKPRVDKAEWIALRIKSNSQRSIQRKYHSQKRFIGENIMEFYYPHSSVNGIEKIIPPFALYLFVKVILYNSFLMNWKKLEDKIIFYYHTNRNHIATPIPEWQMIEFKDSLKDVKIDFDNDDFKVGDKVCSVNGASVGMVFTVIALKETKDLYYVQPAQNNSRPNNLMARLFDCCWWEKKENLKKC